MGKRFRKLDLDNSGALSIDEFMSLPELQQNPLVQRVIDIFDADGNGEVDFKEFIRGVSQFSVKVCKINLYLSSVKMYGCGENHVLNYFFKSKSTKGIPR